MHARFFAPDAHAAGDVVSLPDDEAEHLSRVLRLKRGDPIVVINGRGRAFEATVQSARKAGAEVLIGRPWAAAPEPRVSITLVQAVLKGDKMDDVVRDAVMIGVAAIQPIVTARSEISLSSLARGRRRERWERIAVSSAKQCGRAVVPVVFPPEPFEAVSAFADDRQLPGPMLMLVEPGAGTGMVALGELDGQPPREASLLIGPEGGWTPGEMATASERCRLVTLGGRTIRGDAMALVAVAALFAKWGEY
ncbi:MAG TPA: RsmE family RNA methyltransferase [Vicinamibacterales bacterium]|nr:RsmE family RNA methyltransferase [Vicinamibacterales bacterium]